MSSSPAPDRWARARSSSSSFPSGAISPLDDLDIRAQAERDPQTLWAGATEVILDEVQKAPTLLEAIKIAVDRRNARTRFVL